MKTLIASLACAVALQVTESRGDERVPPPPYAPNVAAAPLPSPPQASPDAAGRFERGLSKVEHLREAADHLEAAGARNLSAEVRAEADSLQEESVELLNQKREQLARLQQEIAELEEVTGCNQQVMLRFRAVEIDAARMTQIGIDDSFLHDTRMMESFVDALATQGLAKVLAEPVLVTTSGRPVTIHSGRDFPIPMPAAFRDSGLTLEAVPVVLGSGRIRLRLVTEVAARDFKDPGNVIETAEPAPNVRRLNTQLEMRFGETVTLFMEPPSQVASSSERKTIRQTSYESKENDVSHVVTVICVTPEPVHAIHAQPVLDPQPIPVPDPWPLPEY